jgi:nicotinamide mononucleotide transporter
MDFSEAQELLFEQFKQVDAIQGVVLVFGVAQVLLARVNNILLYPAGIIATTFSLYSLWDAQLYAESALNFYYIIMSVYGWWHWIKKRNEPPVEVTFASPRDWVTTVLICGTVCLLLYVILVNFTPSTVPLWDAWISATAWAGMWLLARRKVENWILLNISNAFAIPLLFQKELPLFAVLTIILFIVACIGYFDWVKIGRAGKVSAATIH